MNRSVEVGTRSDVGGRDNNEDACTVLSCGPLEVIVLADGAGGHAGGEVAAQQVVAAVTRYFESPEALRVPVAQAVKAALHAGHRAVRDTMKTSARLRDMRSTALIVVGNSTEAWIGHVGDSRAYLVRDERAERLTRDDSLVQSLTDLGELDPEAAKKHSKANVLIQSMGDPKALEYHVSEPIKVRANDRIVACSDGLWEVVTDADIGVRASKGEPADIADRLVTAAIAANASDNVTVGVMHWRSVGERPMTAKHRIVPPGVAEQRLRKRRPRSRRAEVIVLLLLLAIVAGAFVVRAMRDRGGGSGRRVQVEVKGQVQVQGAVG